MKTINKLTFTWVIGLALIAQLVNPFPAYADGETPPPPTDAPEVTAPPATESAVATDVPTTEEATEVPVATETPSVEPVVTDAPTETMDVAPATAEPIEATSTTEPVASTEAVATETTAEAAATSEAAVTEQPTIQEVLQNIPDDTSVVVLDANGQPQALATENAGEIIMSGDPIWCPAGQAPTPGLNDCTVSYGDVNSLLANAAAYINLQSVDGTLWITSGYVNDTNSIVIDGCTAYDSSGNCLLYSNWSNHALTLQGGWSGISNDTSIGSNSIFSVPIGIYNWNNDLTLNNITVENADTPSGYAVTLHHRSAANTNLNDVVIAGNRGNGLNISNTGHVQIMNTTVSNNSGNGADIGWGRVDIKDSQFDYNDGGYGLHIISANDVLIDNSSMSGHWDHGADISAQNVTIKNSYFGYNGSSDYGYGAQVYADNINVLNSWFENNYIGAMFYPKFDVVVDNSVFSKNGWDGLEIFSDVYNTDFANTNNIYLNDNTFYFNNRIASDGYGVWLVTDDYDNVFADGNTFLNNDSGLVAYTYNVFLGPNNYFNLNCTDVWTWNIFLPGNYCGTPLNPDNPFPAPAPITFTHGSARIVLNCDVAPPPPVSLPNGDLIEIHCPVSGVAVIDRRDNTTLPAPLPDGYTYASAFDVKIENKDHEISVINNNGYIKASFLASHLLSNNSDFSVLYWDEWKYENGTWISNPDGGHWVPLKDYLQYGKGPRSFYIDDDIPGMVRRKIISGVELVQERKDTRVEVSVNFPGIFVLAQH